MLKSNQLMYHTEFQKKTRFWNMKTFHIFLTWTTYLSQTTAALPVGKKYKNFLHEQ